MSAQVKTVNIHDAKTNLSKLIKRAESGEEIVIARGGHPVARLLPYALPSRHRMLGADRQTVHIDEHFDAPLPDDVLADFEE
jgi:prevent-host-death family protein